MPAWTPGIVGVDIKKRELLLQDPTHKETSKLPTEGTASRNTLASKSHWHEKKTAKKNKINQEIERSCHWKKINFKSKQNEQLWQNKHLTDGWHEVECQMWTLKLRWYALSDVEKQKRHPSRPVRTNSGDDKSMQTKRPHGEHAKTLSFTFLF